MKNYAKNLKHAEQQASAYFQSEFNHSGEVGIERKCPSHCQCGESQFIEFYSKDDPGMSDTYTVVICEYCYNELV